MNPAKIFYYHLFTIFTVNTGNGVFLTQPPDYGLIAPIRSLRYFGSVLIGYIMSSFHFHAARIPATYLWHHPILFFLAKWLILSALITGSAFFLVSSGYTIQWAEAHFRTVILLLSGGPPARSVYHLGWPVSRKYPSFIRDYTGKGLMIQPPGSALSLMNHKNRNSIYK